MSIDHNLDVQYQSCDWLCCEPSLHVLINLQSKAATLHGSIITAIIMHTCMDSQVIYTSSHEKRKAQVPMSMVLCLVAFPGNRMLSSAPLHACTYQSLHHTLSFSVYSPRLEKEDQRFLVLQQEMQVFGPTVGPLEVHPNFPCGFVVGSWYLKKDRIG